MNLLPCPHFLQILNPNLKERKKKKILTLEKGKEKEKADKGIRREENEEKVKNDEE